MAAKTGHAKNDTIIEVGELAVLFGQALLHIQAGRRTPGARSQLRLALQLFKENTLGAVMSNTENVVSHEDFCSLLSQELRSVLPSRVATYCKKYGMLYVGELFVLPFWKPGERNSKTEAARICRELLEAFGIPFNLKLDKVGWEPPYATDPHILGSLKRTLGEIEGYRLGVLEPPNTTIAWHLRLRFKKGYFRLGGYRSDRLLTTGGVRSGMFISNGMLRVTGDYAE